MTCACPARKPRLSAPLAHRFVNNHVTELSGQQADVTNHENANIRNKTHPKNSRSRDCTAVKKKTKTETDIHATGGIRTRSPSKRSAASPLFRPLGHWDPSSSSSSMALRSTQLDLHHPFGFLNRKNLHGGDGVRFTLNLQPPKWRARVSGMGDPASSSASAGTALGVI